MVKHDSSELLTIQLACTAAKLHLKAVPTPLL
jgi:hypothetical protein